MQKEVNIIYISLSGNTKKFIQKLTADFQEKAIATTTLNIKENPQMQEISDPFVCFLPAYLNGGNGINNGYTEILTTILKKFLAYHNNYQKCYGIIGSGNRNFNKQFALTAKQYAKTFGFPFLAEFELCGSKDDRKQIMQIILAAQAAARQREEKF